MIFHIHYIHRVSVLHEFSDEQLELTSDGNFSHIHYISCELAVAILALLIGKAAGGLACRLAGGLAFAAATGLQALGQVASLQSLDSLHKRTAPFGPVLHG